MSKDLESVAQSLVDKVTSLNAEVVAEANVIMGAKWPERTLRDKAQHLAHDVVAMGERFELVSKAYSTTYDALKTAEAHADGYRLGRVLCRLRLHNVLNSNFFERLRFLFNPRYFRDLYAQTHSETLSDAVNEATSYQDSNDKRG